MGEEGGREGEQCFCHRPLDCPGFSMIPLMEGNCKKQ